MERARAKVLADQLKSKNEEAQQAIRQLDAHKESIRQNLTASDERFCLPINGRGDKPLICSWFAANGLTCDKNVFVERECGYECCCWTVSLQKKKSLWSRLFGK